MPRKEFRFLISLLLGFVLTGLLPAGELKAASLPAPQGISVIAEGSTFIIKWQNPAGIGELSTSAYENYEGEVCYVIDWRVNGGAWHYDREVPAGQDLMDYYGEAISFQFVGMLNDVSQNGKILTQSVIDKVGLGVPYTTPVTEWLKTNSAEFRMRYVYTYWDENMDGLNNQHSPFSNSVLWGSTNPAGNTVNPDLIGYGVPQAPSAIEAPQQLVSEPLTLNLVWRVPESIKTLNTMDLYETDALVDWKLNNGE